MENILPGTCILRVRANELHVASNIIHTTNIQTSTLRISIKVSKSHTKSVQQSQNISSTGDIHYEHKVDKFHRHHEN